ncbi:MAG: hypothetical protein ACRC7C_11055, partial [Beijerinckiaceae bacterium]
MFNRRTILSAFAAGVALLGAQLSPAAAQDKVSFAVTDVDGLESLQREYGPFKDAFEKLTGI